MPFLELLMFLFAFYLLFFSCIGNGFLFLKIAKINNQYLNVGLYGVYGIVALTFYSYLTILIIPHNIYFNLFIHILGLSSFFYYFKDFKLNKKNIFIVIVLSIALLISKNHDDFPFYHLQQSLNFSTNKFQIGLSNLDFSYAYHSSVLYLNSLFYLPYFKYYLFNSANLIIYISTILFFFQNIFIKTEIRFLNFYSLFALVYITSKFSRLSEFGTDLGGQLILIIVFFLTIEMFLKKNSKEKNILIILLLIAYCITVKTYFIFYSILALFIIYKFNFKKFIFLLKKNFIFTLVTIVLLFLFVTTNILTTGCIIFPLAQTCFENLSWSMPLVEIDDYRKWFEIWSKSLAGPNKLVENYDTYLNNFAWLSIWIKSYFPKFIENLSILFFLAIIFIILFKPKNFEFNRIDKNIYLVYSIVLLILIFWFTKHPALRYGGYILIFLFVAMPTCLLIGSNKLSFSKFSKLSSLLIIISLSVFLFKNIKRINEEFNRQDEYKFNNFPYFYVAEVPYERIDLGNQISIYKSIKDACWATPPPCGSVKNLNAKKKLGFVIISRKN